MEYESSLYYEDEAFGGEDLIVTNGYDAIPKNLMAGAVAAGAQLKLNFIVSKVAHVSCSDNHRCVYGCTCVCVFYCLECKRQRMSQACCFRTILLRQKQ